MKRPSSARGRAFRLRQGHDGVVLPRLVVELPDLKKRFRLIIVPLILCDLIYLNAPNVLGFPLKNCGNDESIFLGGVIPEIFCRGSKGGDSSKYKTWIDRMKTYYVYIMANSKNGTLCIGVTNDLIRRVHEHKNDLVEGFTKRYRIHHLVYYEMTDDPITAIVREKSLKKWNRTWKIRLIEKLFPDWKDLDSISISHPE
jgi:putative endonuclease